MEMYARYYGDYDFPISTLFWGASVFLALFVSCFLVWKAIERLRNNLRKFDGAAVDEEHPKDPKDPWDQAISRPPADYHSSPGLGGGGDNKFGGLGSMSQREQKELFSTYAPRRVRKEMRRRRTAREQAQKHQSKSEAYGCHDGHPDFYCCHGEHRGNGLGDDADGTKPP